VVIASSTGGPRALAKLLPKIPGDIPAGIVIIQHIPQGFSVSLAERLNLESIIRVKVAETGEPLRQGEALIVPGTCHLVLEDNGRSGQTVRLPKGDRHWGTFFTADETMKSIAQIYGPDCLGIVLTGMGSDGVEGLRMIKRLGGRTIAEDASTCLIYGMPRAAWESGVVDEMIPLYKMADEIVRWAKEGD
jgi:two-component system chemotaxis response regulator CheB